MVWTILAGAAAKKLANKTSSSAPSKTGPSTKKFHTLNFLRFLNILTLSMCALSLSVLLIHTTKPSSPSFNIFLPVQQACLLLLTVFLLSTEIPRVDNSRFIHRSLPMFAQSTNFLGLGTCMFFVAVSLLSYDVKPDTTRKLLGEMWYRLFFASGVFTNLVASLALLAGVVFGRGGVTARMARARKSGVPDPQPIVLGKYGGARANISRPQPVQMV